jgi:hypothetical protein
MSKKLTLYEINQELDDLLELAQEAFESGEGFDSAEIVEKEFNRLQMARDEKITNIVKFIRNMETLNEGIKEEKARFEKRMKGNNNKIEWLKNYLLIQIGDEKYENNFCKLNLQIK